jgi:hypothetical protein
MEERFKILHIHQSLTTSVSLWSEFVKLSDVTCQWDTLISLDEFMEIPVQQYNLVIFHDLGFPFRMLLDDPAVVERLQANRDRLLFVCRSIKLRQNGFDTVLESALLDKLSNLAYAG